jgi:hypothetical protein
VVINTYRSAREAGGRFLRKLYAPSQIEAFLRQPWQWPTALRLIETEPLRSCRV